MCYHDGIGILVLDFLNRLTGELDVDVARALPEIHLATGLFDDPLPEVGVGHEKDWAVGWCLIDDVGSISRGANDVTESLHAGGAVDVGDDVVILLSVLIEKGFELVGGAGLFEGATGVFVGKNDRFVRIENLGGFGHKVDAAEADDVGVGFLSLVCQTEGIADVVGEILNGADLVVVGQDDGIAFFFEAQNIFFEVEGRCVGHGGSFPKRDLQGQINRRERRNRHLPWSARKSKSGFQIVLDE